MGGNWKTILLSLVCVAAEPLALLACQMPVFRYALERWQPDPIELYVFHREPLSGPAKELADELRRHPAGNYEVTLVDTSKPLDEERQTLLPKNADLSQPLVVARSPVVDGERRVLWSGPLAREAMKPLLASPVRAEVTKRLMTGESIVFLVLRGDAKQTEADDVYIKQLREQLAQLQKKIKLPEGIGTDDSPLLSTLPVEIRFGLIELKRDDPAERLFVEALLLHRPKLREMAGPIVFPFFGRGRVLDALAGDEAKPDVIEEAARFLTAACSCQVKELNPGFDVLLSADWSQVLDGSVAEVDDRQEKVAHQAESAAGAKSAAKTESAPPVYVPIPSGPAKTSDGSTSSGPDGTLPEDEHEEMRFVVYVIPGFVWTSWTIGLGSIAMLVLAVTAWLAWTHR